MLSATGRKMNACTEIMTINECMRECLINRDFEYTYNVMFGHVMNLCYVIMLLGESMTINELLTLLKNQTEISIELV